MREFLGLKRDTLDAYPELGESKEIENGKRYDLEPEHPEVQRALKAESIRAFEEEEPTAPRDSGDSDEQTQPVRPKRGKKGVISGT